NVQAKGDGIRRRCSVRERRFQSVDEALSLSHYSEQTEGPCSSMSVLEAEVDGERGRNK
ncbi:hypothetical protein PIB30_107249, partial [Stylosanthes scabra]|nr:hypothetical protein [Stylosanthes scabra]